MKMSDGEKLIALMLVDLLRASKVQGETDPDFIAKAIISGHTWSIPHRMGGVPFEDQSKPDVVKEVMSILDMWRSIERETKKLAPVQQNDIAARLGRSVIPAFEGFDGNNETDHYSAALFLVEELHLWTEFSGRGLDAHMPTIGNHRGMLTIYKAMNDPLSLDADDLVRILSRE